jgi:hypothetical protein
MNKLSSFTDLVQTELTNHLYRTVWGKVNRVGERVQCLMTIHAPYIKMAMDHYNPVQVAENLFEYEKQTTLNKGIV